MARKARNKSRVSQFKPQPERLGACFALFMYAADPEFDYYSYCQRSLLCNFAGGWQVTMFIRFHVSEFAIMGVQMANFGGQAPRTAV